jgi:methyl acetate hydrolase
MMRRLYLSALAAMCLVAAPRAQRYSSERLDGELRAAIERAHVPGVVVIAADKRHIIYQASLGLADAGNHQPMSAANIFRMASMTKPVTSVAAMQLVEAGRVALDDPAEKYLPDLKGLSVFDSFDAATGAYTVKPAVRPVTVRQLLTHTSGLGYGFVSPVIRDFKPRAGETYAAGPLLFQPGEQWQYGTSTDWVGRLVEELSGRTLEQYFQQHILGPLKMVDTSYNVAEGKQSRVVTLHRRGADGQLTEQPRQAIPSATRPIGGGGLFSTAADYIRFLQMLLNDGRLEGAQIVSARSVRMMAANQIGAVSVRALKTALPLQSADFSFIADGRDKWGLGFLITADHVDGKRSAGSLSWGGIDNTYFWVDRSRGVAGVILMQFLPFADPAALEVYNVFERGVYQLIQ